MKIKNEIVKYFCQKAQIPLPRHTSADMDQQIYDALMDTWVYFGSKRFIKALHEENSASGGR